jgi:hypothetical protein
MSKDRIQIDGVWYVKEVKEDVIEQEPIKLEPTHFEGYAVENDDFSFESIRLFNDEEILYSGIDIKCIDKRGGKGNWEEEIWDNNKWMLGVLENNPDSRKELPDMGGDNIQFLQAFLQYLKDKGWL